MFPTRPPCFPRALPVPPLRVRHLITRADDFGVSPGTNDAILECLDAGFVRNVGVMAPGPFLRRRFAELVERQGSFCPGLHATLNSEWAEFRWGPVLAYGEVPSLVREDGTFHSSTQVLHGRGAVSEMLAEISAQLDLVRRLGLRPLYLDSHMVFTWIPGVAEALDGLCQKEGLLFANGPGFASLPLTLESSLTPGALAGAMADFAAAHPGQRPVWVFHPAKFEEAGKTYFSDPARPSGFVAESRHHEFENLSDCGRMADLSRASHVQPCAYIL